MSYLNEQMTFKLRPLEKAELDLKVKKYPEIYETPSHFCRVAVLRELKREVDKNEI